MDIKEDCSEEEKYVNLFLEIQRFLGSIGKPRSSTVSHYAPIEVIKKITTNFTCLSGGAVYRHTESSSFEDKTEGKYIDIIYQNVLKKMLYDKKIDIIKYKFLSDIKCNDEFFIYVDEKSHVIHASKNKCKYYICCFSENSDSLNMWKTYLKGQHEGCSISHYSIELEEQSNQFFGHEYYHFIRKIIYGKKDQTEYIYNFLDKLLSYDLINDKFSEFYVQRFLNESRFSFKDEKYRNENEVRSIITISESAVSKIINEKIIELNNKYLLYKCNFGFSTAKITFYRDSQSSFKIDSFKENERTRKFFCKSTFST